MSDTPTYTVVVSVEDGNPPPADYTPARKVRVEITAHGQWTGSLDVDHATDAAGDTAARKVAELLGRQPPAKTEPGEATVRKRRTKAEIAADEAAAKAAAAGVEDPTALPPENASTPPAGSSGGAPTASTTVADPTALEEVDVPQQSSGGSEAKPAASDPTALDDFTIQPEPPAVDTSGQIAPVSDGDLNSAVQTKNGALGSPEGTKKIRELIASYNPDPAKVFQLREIPADRRHEFLNSLNAITI